MSEVIDRAGCLGSTIKVAAGHYVDLANPDPETIDIKSIAAALSKICRFGGHCPQFYSVAEHCIHATELAEYEGIKGDGLMAVLLHDATEAYVGDMVKPLKVTMPQYSEAELRFEKAIESRFNISFSKWHDTIKKYDRMMLKAEKQAMWPEDKEKWEGFAEVPEALVDFRNYEPSAAEAAFIRKYDTLKVNTDGLDWNNLKCLIKKHMSKPDCNKHSANWNRGFNDCCKFFLEEMKAIECSKK